MTELEKAAINHRDDLNSYLWSSAQDCTVEYAKEAFIAGAQWQAKQSPWIRVEERIPKCGERVFFVVKRIGKNEYLSGIYHENGIFESEDRAFFPNSPLYSVTHWMPIPE